MGSLNCPMALDDIPDLYQPYLQDWIALAKSKPSEDAKP
jgi:hypothetical protein